MRHPAVVAHRHKTFGGGLAELRQVLADAGFDDAPWYEVDKSREAPDAARRAVDDGADVLFVWGGDGTVQHCLDAVAHRYTALAILPAGTSNSVAANLGVPTDLRAAVHVGLHGDRRRIDMMRANGEPGALMVSSGFSTELNAGASGHLKRRLGRFAYVVSGARALGTGRRRVEVRVDGRLWFAGRAAAVMVRKLPRVLHRLEVAPTARPDDGRLHLTVITPGRPVEWVRLLARLVTGRFEASPFTHATTGRVVDTRFADEARYDIDGGVRPATTRLRVEVDPGAVTICVPASA